MVLKKKLLVQLIHSFVALLSVKIIYAIFIFFFVLLSGFTLFCVSVYMHV